MRESYQPSAGEATRMRAARACMDAGLEMEDTSRMPDWRASSAKERLSSPPAPRLERHRRERTAARSMRVRPLALAIVRYALRNPGSGSLPRPSFDGPARRP